MLDELEGRVQTQALFVLHEAYGEGDDIVLMKDNRELARLPMLRQQSSAAPHLCLADFLLPRGEAPTGFLLPKGEAPTSSLLPKGEAPTGSLLPKGKVPTDSSFCHLGLFAATVSSTFVDETTDDYRRMLAQTLADRLAEATAEVLHEQVRRTYWGYAPHERLSVDELHREAFQGIRPAVGYPSLPDMSLNFLLDDLLDMQQVGIRLTESGMMRPHASVSGLMFAHPKARYFDVGRIGDDQLADYARRRGLPADDLRRFLRIADAG
jgi:cobalamin-dependent methionine synthase I